MNPVDAPFTEYLTFEFDERRPDSAVAFLQWEKKQIPFKIAVHNVNDLYVSRIREEFESWPGFRYEDWQTAAQFCADRKINLEEALTWADKAISGSFRGATVGHKGFSTLQTKASVLESMGRESDADAVMQEALHLPGTDVVPIYVYTVRLVRNGKNDKALKIALFNQQQHPEERFWTYLGLARAYTASGDKKSTVANWEEVLRNLPPDMVGRRAGFEDALKKLKEST